MHPDAPSPGDAGGAHHAGGTRHAGGGDQLAGADHADGADHLDDAALVSQFEALAIPPAAFRHREHVRLAFAMLVGADFGDAAVRYRRALQRFASAAGAPGKYHETLTWAYLAIVHRRMHELPCASSFELLARAPDLLDHRTGALARHYDIAAVTASPLARRVFVLPDR